MTHTQASNMYVQLTFNLKVFLSEYNIFTGMFHGKNQTNQPKKLKPQYLRWMCFCVR